MPSDQQNMYDYASAVAGLLSSPSTKEETLTLIRDIVRAAVEIAGRATINSTPLHVPAILLSAAAEFGQAFGPGGNQNPSLSQIREDDQRAKANPWCQSVCYPPQPILVLKQRMSQKRAPCCSPTTCDRCENLQKVCHITYGLSCNPCSSEGAKCMFVEHSGVDVTFRQLSPEIAAQIQDIAVVLQQRNAPGNTPIGMPIRV